MSSPRLTRRHWLAGAACSVPFVWSSRVVGRTRLAPQQVAAFRVDVTPPLGHPLLGGNFRPAASIGDPLFAHGLVFTGGEKPIAIVTVDWCELRNESYARWRTLIADALATTPENVLVSCVHQHDAPYVDVGAEKLLSAAGATQRTCDLAFQESSAQRVADTAKAALADAVPFTHLGTARAEVDRVASSRRVLKPDGTPYFGRYSQCRDPKLQEQPAGEIDPQLPSLTFYSGDKAVASLRSFAVHPMSPYGRGIVSADFVGDARARRQRDLPQTVQLYGTGCSGDVTAGKYNDGATGVRAQLADRLYDAMVRADKNEQRQAVGEVTARALPIVLPLWDVPELREAGLLKTMNDAATPLMPRAMAALGLSSLRFNQARGGGGHHLDLQVVDFGPAQIAVYPAESFVSFQLQVQAALDKSTGKNNFVLPLGFGECAPGYIPTIAVVREGFREEHGYCWVDDTAERRIVDGMKKLLI